MLAIIATIILTLTQTQELEQQTVPNTCVVSDSALMLTLCALQMLVLLLLLLLLLVYWLAIGWGEKGHKCYALTLSVTLRPLYT